ncbi:nitroreductase family protein [Paenibacillus lignilyticus]|uniref:Nitroreductase family protein n=1 Tax=Paenibacillus lignilyticus TaxID=1172615 RepID=A0ABS5CFG7_9BACL|nr:nitroreductase family protein [Paenibacillus lignilyticus]MBP3964591.1 nitroreductase family protein [Paenibacillus lignilyticus]
MASTTSNAFLSGIRERRTIYALSKESPIPDSRIEEIISDAVKHTPSAFNSQSTRIVLLLGEQHDKLWDITTQVLKAIVPAEQFESTQQKMDSFKAGYGSILFFEDESIVEGLQAQFPTYQDRFPDWSQHTNAMHQFVIWTALANEGLGASLQHYNPLIDEKVKNEWSIPEKWKLIAHMPFGKPTAPAGEKQFKPIEERFKVFK